MKKPPEIRRADKLKFSPGSRHTVTKYIDANGLYSFVQTQPLPTHGIQYVTGSKFEWLCHEFKVNKGKNLSQSDPEGFLLTVTMDYPAHLHDRHSSYPMCPVAREVNDDELSPFAQYSLQGKPRIKSKKLVADFGRRERYPIHYCLLKKALELGLELVEIHKAIQFDQSPFMKEFIEDCLEKRRNAKNKFEKEFFKLKVRKLGLDFCITLILYNTDLIPIPNTQYRPNTDPIRTQYKYQYQYQYQYLFFLSFFSISATVILENF